MPHLQGVTRRIYNRLVNFGYKGISRNPLVQVQALVYKGICMNTLVNYDLQGVSNNPLVDDVYRAIAANPHVSMPSEGI